jgi:prepilin-type N-terminal cleavage/methylation domain-containing protein
MTLMRPNRARGRHRGFTLTEVLIAVVVLLGVLLAAGRIFSTTQQVTGVGEANAEIINEIAAIEEAMRTDLANISRQGVLVIRNIEVPNDIRGAGRPLVNPALPATAVIRSDQLMFIRDGVQRIQTISVGAGEKVRPTGVSSRVYYGHGFTLGEQSVPAISTGTTAFGWDVVSAADNDVHGGIPPWFDGPINLRRFSYNGFNVFQPVGGVVPRVKTPTDARQWPLVRAPIILVDDNGPEASLGLTSFQRTRYLDENGAGSSDYGGAQSYFTAFVDDPRGLQVAGRSPRHVLSGRADAAASGLDDIRDAILVKDPDDPGDTRWFTQDPDGVDQRTIIEQQLMFQADDTVNPPFIEYPRVERRGPSSSRVDHALVNDVMGTAVSDIRIEWTWRDGTGTVSDAAGADVPAVDAVRAVAFGIATPDVRASQPWFGLWNEDLGVRPMSEPVPAGGGDAEWIINPQPYDGQAGQEILLPENIERYDDSASLPNGDIRIYSAVFGFNNDRPLFLSRATGEVLPPLDDDDRRRLGFTPWPDAIRVTLTLHDTDARLENGRQVQFIIDLPETGSDR